MIKYIIKVNGNPYEVEVQEIGGPGVAVTPASAPKPKGRTSAGAGAVKTVAPSAASAGDVAAPMPGTVLKVKVAAGDTVKKGQVLLILEAMKMENEIVAPMDGKVVALNVEPGKSVTAREVMVTIG